MAVWICLLNLAAFWAGRFVGPPRRLDTTSQPVAPRRWVRLPSGLSHDYAPGVTGYVMPTDDGAYWWLSRNGRTVIEGPCETVDAGKIEVAQAAREWVACPASFHGRA